MRRIDTELARHLKSGATSLCRCWRLERRDGAVFGFTDHDRDLVFDDTVYRAGSGLDAAAVQASTGLSVDNSQAVGALSDIGVDEHDIRAGLYDGAAIVAMVVNWQDPTQRSVQFRGSIGEIRCSDGVFEAELRGLAEALNQPQGRAYHRRCSAVLGDSLCRFDVAQAGFSEDVTVEGGANRFAFDGLSAFGEGWFTHGVFRVLTGKCAGMAEIIRSDQMQGGQRLIELWRDLPQPLQAGDSVRLVAGCDKSSAACREKFFNFLNFRGFPHIPGQDWAMTFPVAGERNDGGSRL